MAELFCLLNHSINSLQRKEVRNRFGINVLENLPKGMQNIWQNISPEGDLNLSLLNQITDWLKQKSKSGDFVLVQGEYGATFYIVDFCFKNGLVPIYATSKRIYKEEKLIDGSVMRQHLFRHVNFRKYVRWGQDSNE